LRARERWTRERFEQYQAQALRALRDYTYAHPPFYQQFHKGLYDAHLQDLPVLTKGMVMDHFDNLVTDRTLHPEEVRAFMANQRADERFLGRYLVHATSGSSGHPGAFLANEAEWLTMRVSAFGAFEWAGIKINSRTVSRYRRLPRQPGSTCQTV
jgi:phenylacetate-CoA ligase